MGRQPETMKLCVLAFALCAVVALAAPRANFLENEVVPEELVQVGAASNVATLKHQFHELQMQLQDGAEVTPQVKKTIDKMIGMVTDEIEPAITEAHADDQEILKDEANTVRNLIDDEQAAAAKWDSAASLFTSTQNAYLKTYDDQTDTCCQKQNSAVLDVEYVPASVTCDYTVPAGATCSKRARDAVAAIVTTPFTDGLALYKSLLGKCSDLTSALAAADSDTTAKITDCQAKKRDEKAASELASTEQARVQAAWDKTIREYNGNYTVKNTDYQHHKTIVQGQETDRKEEWKATQQIKCMLKAYKEGGGFDQTTADNCNTGITVALDIGYPEEVPQLFPELEPFEDQTDTSAYEHVCDARTPAPVYTCVVREPRPSPECSPWELAQ